MHWGVCPSRCSLLSLVLLGLALRSATAARVQGSGPPLEGPPLVGQDVNVLSYRLPEQPSHQLWPGTSSRASISHHSKRARSLLATELEVSNSNASAICTSSELPWPAIPGYGHLVSDNWVCTNPNRPDKLHGGSAQGFADRPSWDTYGWATFQVPNAPAGSPRTKARLEGLNLLVLGNQGQGGVGTCKIDSVEIAIFGNSNSAPTGTAVYEKELVLAAPTKTNSKTFTWTGNVSTVLSMDIVDKSSVSTSADPPAVELDFSTKYWLRVKILSDYGNTTKCFVHWALNNVSKTGDNCLWQEAKGGALGYSTLCTGAATGALPPASQTLASCFNGARAGSTGIRRCLTYRNTVANPITCPAQFIDFAFAFYGHNAANCSAAPALTLSNGIWPPACAGKPVDAQCYANCTYGPATGVANTTCLITGEWSTTITGSCPVPPASCADGPSPAPTDGLWPSCAGQAISSTCAATCTWGPTNSSVPTATCQRVEYQYPTVTAWTTTGACYPAPTACPEGPPTQPTDGQWNVSCAGIGINETCKANCTWGPVAAAAPTATCELRPNAYPATTGWSTAGTCNAEPTNCTGQPTAPLAEGSWGTCNTGTGVPCVATCNWGYTGGSAPTATCQTVPYGDPTYTTWVISGGSCNLLPTTCPTGPSGGLLTNYGTWESGCAGASINHVCDAECPGGGTANITCQTVPGQPQGSYVTVVGACNTACPATPSQTLDDGGSWTCSDRAVDANCTATCPYGGNPALPSYTCGSGGAWTQTTVGDCEPGCAQEPTENINVSWPVNSCDGASFGATCTADCGNGTLITATCGAGGTWGAASGTC